MSLRKKALLPIGIHLNLEYVHMVQLEQSEGSLHLVSTASQYYEPPPAVSEASSSASRKAALDSRWEEPLRRARQFVRHTLSSDGFRGKRVVFSLPAEHVFIQHVRTPPMPPEELATSLPWELQGKLPFDPRGAVVRHMVVGTVSENNEAKQDVLVMAARRQTVERYIGSVEKLGLEVMGVGIESCAMCYPYAFEAMRALPSQGGPSNLMLVHLTSFVTHVAIVRGQEATFVKDMEIGTDHLAKALAAAKNVSLEEARRWRARWRDASDGERAAATDESVQDYHLIRREMESFADEFKSCIRYYASVARGAQVDRIVFVGPEARDRGLVRVLGAQVNVPCEVGDPVGTAIGEAGAAGPELAVATGLSLFGVA